MLKKYHQTMIHWMNKMNERIKELIEQAGFEEKDGRISIQGVYMFNTTRMEKFAELIVKECADICNKIYFDRYPDAEDFERSEEGDAIKEHFGVKE